MSKAKNDNLSFKGKAEVVLFTLAIFLFMLYFFSVGMKKVDLRSTFVALMATYIALYLWERRVIYRAKIGRTLTKKKKARSQQ